MGQKNSLQPMPRIFSRLIISSASKLTTSLRRIPKTQKCSRHKKSLTWEAESNQNLRVIPNRFAPSFFSFRWFALGFPVEPTQSQLAYWLTCNWGQDGDGRIFSCPQKPSFSSIVLLGKSFVVR